MAPSDPYTQALALYSRLAQQAGWKDYTWHAAKTMEREMPDLFTGFAADLTAEVKRQQASSAPPANTGG